MRSRIARKNPFPLPQEFLDYVFSQVKAAERQDEEVWLDIPVELLRNWRVLGTVGKKMGVTPEFLLWRLTDWRLRLMTGQDVLQLKIRWDSPRVPKDALGTHHKGKINVRGWWEDDPDFWYILRHELTHYGQFLLALILNQVAPEKHVLSAGWRRPFRKQDERLHDPQWLSFLSPEEQQKVWYLSPGEFYPVVESLIPEAEKLSPQELPKLPHIENLKYEVRNIQKILLPTQEGLTAAGKTPEQQKVLELLAASVQPEEQPGSVLWIGPPYTKKALLKILRPLFGAARSQKAIDGLLHQGLAYWGALPGRPRVYEKALSELATRTAHARKNPSVLDQLLNGPRWNVYAEHFVNHPYVVFSPATGHGREGWPVATHPPASWPEETYEGISLYPRDGDGVLFGFNLEHFAEAFARQLNQPYREIDVALAKAIHKKKEMLYAVWFWRSNYPRIGWFEFLRQHRRFQPIADEMTDYDFKRAMAIVGDGSRSTPSGEDVDW